MKILRVAFTSIASAAIFACGGDASNLPVSNATIPTDLRDAGAQTPIADAPNADHAAAKPQLESESAIKPDNLAPIGAAAGAMAMYLNAMHDRIHPIFTDEILVSLSQQRRDEPMNDMRLVVELEIVINPDGSIAKLGIIKSSGIQEFDYKAIDALLRARPFGPTPKIIQSPDGMFYMHWAFHRDPVLGCSTANVRPFLLKN